MKIEKSDLWKKSNFSGFGTPNQVNFINQNSFNINVVSKLSPGLAKTLMSNLEMCLKFDASYQNSAKGLK